MILSDNEIKKRMAWPLASGGLRVDPWADDQVGPASYDVTLGTHVLLYRDDMVRVDQQRPLEIDLRDPYGFELRPGDFALACTTETVAVGNSVSARVAGKSSRAREGLVIEAAGFIDPGFVGQITLELVAHRPFRLTPGLPIGQVVFFDSYPSTHSYAVRGHYTGQTGPTPSWKVG